MKGMKKKAKSVSKFIPSTILSFGHYDLDYLLELNDDDVKKFHINDVTELKTFEDIAFIIDNQYLWNKIKIITNNRMINLFLYINKLSIEVNKSYIEYISFETPVFYNQAVKTMFKTVNDFNFFFINDNSLNSESKKYFKLTIRYQGQETIINFEDLKDDNKIEKEEEEKNNDKDKDNKNEEKKEEKIEEEKKEENNDTKKEGNEEKKDNEDLGLLKNSKNIFNNIKLDCGSYNYFICSIEDTLEITPYEDFVDFIFFVKLNLNSNIVIEYGDVSEYFNDKESMGLLNKLYLLTDIFLFEEKDAINTFKKHFEIFTKENEKKKSRNDEGNKNQTEKEINKNIKQEENNKNQIVNTNNNKKTDNNPNIINKEKNMTERDLYNYFKNTIVCNGALSILNTKLGIFLDNYFSKITFIEVPLNTKATTLSYEIKPYPKLSHTTVDIVDFYKTKLRQNKKLLKSIFYAGVLNKILASKKNNIGLEILYKSYLIGHEILKKMLHLIATGLKLPENPKFYHIKINNNEVNEYVKKENLNNKENKFVLDCTNLKKSKLKYYMPLFDYNLNEFFGNKLMKKQLINKGFIDSKGFVNYDPVYMKELGMFKKNIIKTDIDPIDKKNNFKREIDSNFKNMKHRVLNNMPTKIKLPAIQSKIKK